MTDKKDSAARDGGESKYEWGDVPPSARAAQDDPFRFA
jgi:hypothetical protein